RCYRDWSSDVCSSDLRPASSTAQLSYGDAPTDVKDLAAPSGNVTGTGAGRRGPVGRTPSSPNSFEPQQYTLLSRARPQAWPRPKIGRAACRERAENRS